MRSEILGDQGTGRRVARGPNSDAVRGRAAASQRRAVAPRQLTERGAGMVAGTWANAHAGSDLGSLRRRWLFGIALSGGAMSVAGLAPNLTVALIAFALIGLGESLLVGPEMRLVQEMVSERLLGRVFGLKDVLENIGFVTAFVVLLFLCLGEWMAQSGSGWLTDTIAAPMSAGCRWASVMSSSATAKTSRMPSAAARRRAARTSGSWNISM